MPHDELAKMLKITFGTTVHHQHVDDNYPQG